MKELDKLTKPQLKELAKELLYWHEQRYKEVEQGGNPAGSFYQLAGHIQSVRINFNLPKLY